MRYRGSDDSRCGPHAMVGIESQRAGVPNRSLRVVQS